MAAVRTELVHDSGAVLHVLLVSPDLRSEVATCELLSVPQMLVAPLLLCVVEARALGVVFVLSECTNLLVCVTACSDRLCCA